MPKRKIPARKHHGIRDPVKQAQDRFNKIKDKIDNPPINRNEQKFSNSFARFVKLKDDAKCGKSNKSRGGVEDFPRSKDKNGNARPVKKLSEIRQRADESDRNFMNRVHATTKEAMIEAQYEAKYDVDVVRDQKTGEVKVQKRKDIITKKNKNLLNNAQKQMIKDEIKKHQNMKKEEKFGKIPEYQNDQFKFGEVVNAPPVLNTLPRKAEKTEKTLRPGKGSLILTSLIKNNATQIAQQENYKPVNKVYKPVNKVFNKVDLTMKRKDLPSATRVMLENERDQTVEIYRMLKKKNRLDSKI